MAEENSEKAQDSDGAFLEFFVEIVAGAFEIIAGFFT